MYGYSRYWKTILSALGTVVGFIVALNTEPGFQQVVADSNVTESEFWMLVTSVVTTIGVFAKKNVPPVGQPPDPNISEATR